MATVTKIRKTRKYRKSAKIRKNSAQGKHDVRTRAAREEKVWLVCKKCEVNGSYCDAGTLSLICARCVVRMVPFPILKPRETTEEKSARLARKVDRETRKAAIADGTYVEPKSRKDMGFGRGWHKKMLFKTGTNGTTEYFTRGEKITKKEYTRLNREQKNTAKEKTKTSFGRGWHFKAVFIAPNGDRYEKGKLVEKA